MDVIRALIVDDEPLARERIRTLLRAEPDVEVIAECGDGKQARRLLLEGGADVAFLDVQMPELDGFEAVRALPEDGRPRIVFVTAHDRYALRAFDVRAFDYLLKPFDPDRFRETVARVRASLRRPGRPEPVERLPVKEGGRIRFVKLEEIEFVEAAGNYVCLHVKGQSHVVRETMAEMEAQLDPRRFLRIHRSAIVNTAHLSELRPSFGGDYVAVLDGGKELPVSRNYREKLRGLVGAAL